MKKFDNWLGEKLAFGLSTMTCFYLICVMVILPLIWQRPHTLVEWMQYIVSVFFQGSALPLLGYVTRIGGDRQEAILNDTHEKVLAEFSELKEVHEQTTLELTAIGQNHALILEQLAEIRKDMNGGKHE